MFFFFVFFLHFYVELYHNYQIYLEFAHISHKTLLSLFVYPKVCLKLLIEWVDRMANSIDPHQTDPNPIGAVSSVSTLLGLLRPTCLNI